MAVKKLAINKTFIREWRIYRGLTQAQLAARMDWDRSHISKIEAGLGKYTQPLIDAVAEALDCEPGDLLSRDPSKPPAEIVDLLGRMNPATQAQLLAIARALAATAAA